MSDDPAAPVPTASQKGRPAVAALAAYLPTLAVALALAFASLVAWTWLARVPYPYDLEWMEGGMLAHAWRLLHGLPIYGPPSPDFAPYVYPPGYSAVVAALGAVVGLSPALGRVVSIVGSVGALASLVFLVRRAGGAWWVAVCAAAVLLAAYRGTGAYLDLVRPDGLCLGLIGWSVALATVPGRRAVLGSAALLVCAFLVKQNAAVFGLPLLLAIARRDGPQEGAVFASASIFPALLAVALLQVWSGGWFLTWTLTVPSSHAVDPQAVLQITPREWGTPLPVALAALTAAVLWTVADEPGPVPKPLAAVLPVVVGMVSAAFGTYNGPPPDSNLLNSGAGVAYFALGAVPTALALAAVRWRAAGALPSWEVLLAVGLAVVGATGGAWMRGHAGGFLNVHLPTFWVVALGTGWGAAWALARWPSAGMRSAVALAFALQIGWALARFDRSSLVPTRDDYARGKAMVAAIREVDGPVLSPFAAWLPVYAGKPPSLHRQGLWDLELSPAHADDTKPVRQAVREHYWTAILAGNQKFPYALDKYYETRDTLVREKSPGLMPKTGYRARPERWMVPRGTPKKGR